MSAIPGSSLRPTAIDLYAGAGGLSLGLEQAGFDVVLAIDRDPYHVATHRRNFPHVKAVSASVADLKARHLRTLVGSDRQIDLICGGPPCQGFSSMGKRYHSDPRNTLVDEFVRIVIALKPKAFLMENVPSLQVGQTAAVFNRAIRRLTAAGYQITSPVQTLNAADFGVPQRRVRLFVIGVLKEIGVGAHYPSGACGQQPARPTVWEAICDLPALMGRDDLFKIDDAAYRSVPDNELHDYVKVARGLRQDNCDLSYSRSSDASKCSGCLRIKHRPDVERLYAATSHGGTVPAHNLLKLRPDGLAPTLRAGTDSEHGSYNAPRPVHPFEPRCITVREAARLHGFPDWFKFYPRKWHAHRQIGNSVCPPVARALGAAIVRALGYAPTRPADLLRLDDDFTLDPGAKKHHARISQVAEWPKVIAHLVKRAKPLGTGLVRRPDFSVEDVRRAYRATKARMPRTPPDRFLQDIAQSRNRRWLLSPAHDAGLSIVRVSGIGTYGRFVPLRTLGAISDKNCLAFSSSAIANAFPIKAVPGASLQDTTIFKYLRSSQVARTIVKMGSIHVSDMAEARVERGRTIAPFEIVRGAKCLRRGIAISVNSGELPILSSLATMMNRAELGTAIIIARVTNEHFAVMVVRLRDFQAVERQRAVFRVQPGAQSRVPQDGHSILRGT